MKILIIEDDPNVIEIMARTLETKWFEATLFSADRGEVGIELAKKEPPDIVILDLVLPDTDGFQVLRRIRSFSDVLVIITTAKGEEDSRIRGLQEGADDYVVKPFSPSELIARMKALIRRREMTESISRLTARKASSARTLSVNLTTQEVTLGNNILNMGPRQYELLDLLVTNKGKVFTKREFMDRVFPENDVYDTRFVDVYINKLREQLEENPDKPKMILDEGTTGYKFVGSCTIVRYPPKEAVD